MNTTLNCKGISMTLEKGLIKYELNMLLYKPNKIEINRIYKICILTNTFKWFEKTFL